MRSLALLVLLILAVMCCSSSVTYAAGNLLKPTPVVTPLPSTTSPADMLLASINRDRKAHHVSPLILDTRQSSCSKAHSRHMAVIGQLAHDQFPSDVCVPYRAAAENIGEISGDAATVLLTLHQSMMAEGPCSINPCSPAEFAQHGHFLNLLNPTYRHIGIGVVTKSGVTWLTEDFTD